MSLTFLAPFLLFLIVLLLVLLFLSLLQLLLSCWFCCCSLLIHPRLLFFFLLLSLFEQGWTAPSISWSSGNESFSFLSQDTSPWRQILSEVYTWCFWSFTASLFCRRILLFACPWDFIHEQDSMFLFRCISHNLSYTNCVQILKAVCSNSFMPLESHEFFCVTWFASSNVLWSLFHVNACHLVVQLRDSVRFPLQLKFQSNLEQISFLKSVVLILIRRSGMKFEVNCTSVRNSGHVTLKQLVDFSKTMNVAASILLYTCVSLAEVCFAWRSFKQNVLESLILPLQNLPCEFICETSMRHVAKLLVVCQKFCILCFDSRISMCRTLYSITRMHETPRSITPF